MRFASPKWTSWTKPAGWREWRSRASCSGRSASVTTGWRLVRPWRMALRDEAALSAALVGPVPGKVAFHTGRRRRWVVCWRRSIQASWPHGSLNSQTPQSRSSAFRPDTASHQEAGLRKRWNRGTNGSAGNRSVVVRVPPCAAFSDRAEGYSRIPAQSPIVLPCPPFSFVNSE